MKSLGISNKEYENITNEQFILSLMPIIDDKNNKKKYFYLKYIEFLEYICRIAVILFNKSDELLEFKV